MSSVTRPLGPHPSRVYWTRRLLLLAVVFALVFAVARLLGGGGAAGNSPSAQPVGAAVSSPSSSSSSPTTPAASSPAAIGTAQTVSSSPTATQSPATKAGKSPTSTALPSSSGSCSTSDIVVTPTIKDQAHAGKPVVFAMSLTTRSSSACDFAVAPDSLVVKVTSGSDRIWSTQDCPKAIPVKSVVVRKDTPVNVDVTWNGMRSDSSCTRTTSWAQPGYYHAMAAVFGAEPVDDQFELLKPARPTVTAKPSPHATSGPKSGSKPSTKPSSHPSSNPSSKPSKKPGH